MMNLACWAVPIRDGYVLRADRSTATILRAAPARSPQFWGWRIALIQPQSQQFSAPLAARAAVLALDYVRLAGGAAPTDESPRRRRAAIWMEVALGLALIVASGGHWVPALAGAWLVTGRRWVRSFLQIDAQVPSAPAAPAQSPLVSSEAHAGLAQIERSMRDVEDDAAAYALGAVQARGEGLDEAAEIYEALSSGTHPAMLPPHVGFWVANETMHDPWRLALPAPAAATDDAT